MYATHVVSFQAISLRILGQGVERKGSGMDVLASVVGRGNGSYEGMVRDR